jgi:hypothetical protein
MLALMMKSRYHAALFATAFVLVGMLVPVMPLLAGAVVVLVGLHHGWREGLLVTGIAVAILALLSSLAGANPVIVFIMTSLWLALLLAAHVTRVSGTISTGLAMILLPCLAVALYLGVRVSEDFWLQWINAQIIPILEQSNLPAEMINQTRQEWSGMMNQMMVGMMAVMLFFGLLVGRFWQAKLYNPSGFGREFRQLRLGKKLATVAAGILVLSFLPLDAIVVLSDMTMAVAVLFMLQGLAIAHYAFHHYQTSALLMVPFYMAVVMVLQVSMVVLAIAGIADNWLNLRKKLVNE